MGSKVDELRAMREARYTGKSATKKAAVTDEQPCGFTSIGRKRCLALKGHDGNHRYK